MRTLDISYRLGHRTTWALLPWSTAALAWLNPAQRILHVKVGGGEGGLGGHQESSSLIRERSCYASSLMP